MRRSIAALCAALLTGVAALAIAFTVAACGSSATVTTTQARPSGMPQGAGAMGGPGTMMSSQLDALVKKGTITAAQQKSIVAALKSSMTGVRPSAGATPGAQPSAGAQPQGGGQPSNMSSMYSKALDPLVKDGTITGAQETAVIAALSTRPQSAPSGAQQGG